jgi:hypothetical protein
MLSSQTYSTGRHTIILPEGFEHNNPNHDTALGYIVNALEAKTHKAFMDQVKFQLNQDIPINGNKTAFQVYKILAVNVNFHCCYS